jgi:hypothetical protein
MKRKDGVACMPSFSSLVDESSVQCMLSDDEEEGWCSLHAYSISSLVDESSVQCMLGDDEEEGWCSLHAQYFLCIV